MDFFKVKSFRKAHRSNLDKDAENKSVPTLEEPKNDKSDDLGKSVNVDPATEAEEDDDDFILDEVKRRLKELRRNSFMVLIPEESGLEDEEEEEQGETSSSEWRDAEPESRQPWCGFDAAYDKYCEQMLFFDRLNAQQLNEVGSHHMPATPSPRSASKKLTSPLRCLSLKRIEGPDNETEHLQQPENHPLLDLETAYVAQVCLTWEALHSQYTNLSQNISCQPENPTCYNQSAQQFQQFQVLLQRYIENEPFEQGLRAEIYARSRSSFPKLLQVPNIQGSDKKGVEGEESDSAVLATDLITVMESSIFTFHLFLKMDKKRSSGVRNIFGGQNQLATPLQQVQTSLEKKEMKLKELRKRMKGWKNKSWLATQDGVELFFSLIDVKVMSRVLRMVRITKEQLFWCEEKMKKLDLSEGRLQREPSPILFPC